MLSNYIAAAALRLREVLRLVDLRALADVFLRDDFLDFAALFLLAMVLSSLLDI